MWCCGVARRLWRAFAVLQLGRDGFMATRGLTFYLICFYLMVVGIVATLAAGVWVAYSLRANELTTTW
jgi:hypothetical protein